MLSSFQPYGPAEVFPGLIAAPNGGLVHFVHSSGAAALDLLPPGLTSPVPGGFFTSIAAAGASCRANRGDTIVVLPGSTDIVATANPWSTMPAGVTIRGMGEPGTNQRPTINFTAAASTLVFPANTTLDNFQIVCDATAAIVVAAPITISAAGCKLTRNIIRVATSATQLATVPITVAAGADDCLIADNNIWTVGAGTFGTNPTNHVRVTGAVKGFRFLRNEDYGSGSAAGNGLLEFTAAATNVWLHANSMHNLNAASAFCMVGFAGMTGRVSYNSWGVSLNGTAATSGFGTYGSLVFFQNFCTDETQKSGVLSPAAAT